MFNFFRVHFSCSWRSKMHLKKGSDDDKRSAAAIRKGGKLLEKLDLSSMKVNVLAWIKGPSTFVRPFFIRHIKAGKDPKKSFQIPSNLVIMVHFEWRWLKSEQTNCSSILVWTASFRLRTSSTHLFFKAHSFPIQNLNAVWHAMQSSHFFLLCLANFPSVILPERERDEIETCSKWLPFPIFIKHPVMCDINSSCLIRSQKQKTEVISPICFTRTNGPLSLGQSVKSTNSGIYEEPILLHKSTTTTVVKVPTDF